MSVDIFYETREDIQMNTKTISYILKMPEKWQGCICFGYPNPYTTSILSFGVCV